MTTADYRLYHQPQLYRQPHLRWLSQDRRAGTLLRFGLSILAATCAPIRGFSGTKNNVFGIQTGVAISFLVKRKGAVKAAAGFLCAASGNGDGGG